MRTPARAGFKGTTMHVPTVALILVFWVFSATAAARSSVDDPAPAEQEESACSTPDDVGNPGCDEVDSEEEETDDSDTEEEDEDE